MSLLDRRRFIALSGGAALAWPSLALAQPGRGTVRKIGFLSAQPQTYQDRFGQGLRDLGYVIGRDIEVHCGYSAGRDVGLDVPAAELLAIPVEVIVATSSSATEAAMAATTDVPIVMVTTGDPVGQGYIAALGAPGGNVTGQSMVAPELGVKQLEFLRNLAPQAAQAAVIWNPLNGADRQTMQLLPDAADTLDFDLHPVAVTGRADILPAFAAAEAAGADSLIVLIDQATIANRRWVIWYAQERRWPAVYPLEEFVLEGGFTSYGVSFGDLYYNAAAYVDRILRGADPATEPVAQATRFYRFVNHTAAAAIGMTISPSMEAIADEVVEVAAIPPDQVAAAGLLPPPAFCQAL
jgi:putative ABC transport system substrate-binding protein